jgi:hypothetical protein
MNNLTELYDELYALVSKMTGELSGRIIHQQNPRIDPDSGVAILKRLFEDGRATRLANGNYFIEAMNQPKIESKE